MVEKWWIYFFKIKKWGKNICITFYNLFLNFFLLIIGGATALQSMKILLKRCLLKSKIPETWKSAQVIWWNKKDDKLKLVHYRPIILLPHPYTLLTKIITNRLSEKLDDYQPPEQAGFR